MEPLARGLDAGPREHRQALPLAGTLSNTVTSPKVTE
jgi:hypothetical protein